MLRILRVNWEPLSEERQEEASLLAHGLTERSVQEWFYGEEFPTPEEVESFNATLRLLGGAWVLTR